MSDKNNKSLPNAKKEWKRDFDYLIIIFVYVSIAGILLFVYDVDRINFLFVIPSMVNIISFVINLMSNNKKLTKVCAVIGLITGFVATIINIWVIIKLHIA